MRRKIPSTAALTAFESAARHQSFTKAAEDLAVTQSAICRQIATLEDFLNVKLFRRSKRGVVLTEAGTDYSRRIAARLDEVERDTLETMARRGQGGTIELSVVPTFATKWLLPRLVDFSTQHADICVNLSARARPFLFAETNFDAAIHAGESRWPGTDGQFLMHETLVAVCSPRIVPAPAPSGEIAWQRQRLLQASTRPYAWRRWFESLGLRIEGDMAGPRFELFSMIAAAAVAGMGVGLLPRFLVEDELARGTLVQLGGHRCRSERAYHLIYPEHKAETPALTTFRHWLVAQATHYRDSTAPDAPPPD